LTVLAIWLFVCFTAKQFSGGSNLTWVACTFNMDDLY